jgi:protein-tyrosine phosphatase
LTQVIDLHCHVLPGIDDGPESIEGSVALARAAANLGVRTMVATPHVSTRYPNSSQTIIDLASQLERRLAAEEVSLEILPGAELAVTRIADLEPEELARLRLGGGPWLLIEAPLSVSAPDIGPAMTDLQRSGFRILLAHPERCPAYHRAPATLESLIQGGVLTSITAGAFAGRFGGRVRRFALDLTRAGMVHSVASDAHDRSQRPPGMTAELKQAGLGGLTDWLTREVPEAILRGSDIPRRPNVALEKGTRRRGMWWHRSGDQLQASKRASWPRSCG